MALAIRTATRLQDQDDVNVTPGPAVDGYALTWDNATSRFVLSDVAVVTTSDAETNPSTILAGDANGAIRLARLGVGIAPVAGGINLQDTTTATTGIVFKNGTRFIHNFQHPTGGGAVPTGKNIFIGEGAGNFTLGSTATLFYQSSYNIGVGQDVFRDCTTGYDNIVIGGLAGRTINTGYLNVVIGKYAANNLTVGFGNFALGANAMYFGVSSSGNVCIGEHAGSYTNVGNNTYSANCIFIGATTKSLANADTNEIVIGNTAIGAGSNTVTLGNTSVVQTVLRGRVDITTASVVAGITQLFNITALGSGANGDGGAVYLRGKSSTTAAQDMARVQWLWNDATHATRKADLVFSAFDTAEREGMRIRGDGSEPALGFYGVAPVARQLLATGTGATVDNVIAALQNLGLLKQA